MRDKPEINLMCNYFFTILHLEKKCMNNSSILSYVVAESKIYKYLLYYNIFFTNSSTLITSLMPMVNILFVQKKSDLSL